MSTNLNLLLLAATPEIIGLEGAFGLVGWKKTRQTRVVDRSRRISGLPSLLAFIVRDSEGSIAEVMWLAFVTRTKWRQKDKMALTFNAAFLVTYYT